VQALRVAIPALVVSLFVSADMVSSMLNAIPEFVTRGLQIAGGFIVVVGYAMVLRMMGVKYLMPFFFLGFLAGAISTFSLLAFGGVGVIIALIYIQLNPQWRKAEPPHPPLPPPLTSLTTDGAQMEQKNHPRRPGEHVSALQPAAGLLQLRTYSRAWLLLRHDPGDQAPLSAERGSGRGAEAPSGVLQHHSGSLGR
jgi:hypothetical protein